MAILGLVVATAGIVKARLQDQQSEAEMGMLSEDGLVLVKECKVPVTIPEICVILGIPMCGQLLDEWIPMQMHVAMRILMLRISEPLV